jgi:hypothetical protein
MWICQECGRKFARNNQTHSCVQYHPEEMFFGKSEHVQGLYNVLIDKIKEFGEVEVHSAKWNVTVRRLSMFSSILIEKNHLTVVFLTSEPIDEFPVYQNYQHTKTKFSNLVKIETVDEIDDQLIRWLKQAWELAV